MKIIATRSTSASTMDISPIVVRENTVTRLVFYPQWVSTSTTPLRGGFRFQRKSPKGTWIDVDHKPLSSLKKDEGYELNLDGKDIAKLFSELERIKSLIQAHGHSYGTRTFLLDEANAPGVFLQIGEIENRDWVIKQLKSLESGNFENLGSVIGSARIEKIIAEFSANMENNDEKFWQEFFESNPWILQQIFSFPVIYLNGETLLGGKNTKGRNGQGGVVTDFLFKNGSNGSFAVVEIKTPGSELVGSLYRGKQNSDNNNETYEIHGDLSGGLVQLENQVFTAMKDFRSMIGEDFKDITMVNPHGILITGTYKNLNSDKKKKSFDLFRKSLGKNQILTFDEVLKKLELLKKVYEN